MTAWREDRFKVRFLERIDVQEDGCWLWIGQRAERYGRFYAGNTEERWAHRNAWRLAHDCEIPGGMHVHHRCETGFCVNPDHLELLTPEDHYRQHPAVEGRPHGLAKGWVEKCRCDTCKDAVRQYRRAYTARVRAEVAAQLRPVPHGTLNGYTLYGCRCDECRSVNTKAGRAARGSQSLEAWRASVAMKHGTTSMYTAGKCRCDECRANWSEYWKAYRRRKKEAS